MSQFYEATTFGRPISLLGMGDMVAGKCSSGPWWQWAMVAVGPGGSGPRWQWANVIMSQGGYWPRRQWAKVAMGQGGSGPRWQWAKVAMGQGGSGPRWQWAKVAVGQGGSGPRPKVWKTRTFRLSWVGVCHTFQTVSCRLSGKRQKSKWWNWESWQACSKHRRSSV